jgi:glycosyltransferase involved in cell wall biosynthesis
LVKASPKLRALLVDPSLFTAPYDAALTRGLQAAGVAPTWAVRPARAAERTELPPACSEALFYGWLERQTGLPLKLRAVAKGCAHAWGLVRLVKRALELRPDVVHFQWVVVPPLDSAAMLLLRLFCPLVVTVHDTVPHNGDRLSFLQRWGFDLPLRLSDRVIVHTLAGRDALLARGVPLARLCVVPHGALPLHESPSLEALSVRADGYYRFVLFGELKSYKGIDVLVEALAQLPAALRSRLRVIVAGRPRMPLQPLLARIAELGLSDVLEVRAQRQTEQQMADLFAQADCFLFPYRQIDASGVYFLVKSLGKWLIASKVGIFAEELRQGEQGELVPAGDPSALARAMASAVEARREPGAAPQGTDWTEIGEATRELYRDAQASRSSTRPALVAKVLP